MQRPHGPPGGCQPPFENPCSTSVCFFRYYILFSQTLHLIRTTFIFWFCLVLCCHLLVINGNSCQFDITFSYFNGWFVYLVSLVTFSCNPLEFNIKIWSSIPLCSRHVNFRNIMNSDHRTSMHSIESVIKYMRSLLIFFFFFFSSLDSAYCIFERVNLWLTGTPATPATPANIMPSLPEWASQISNSDTVAAVAQILQSPQGQQVSPHFVSAFPTHALCGMQCNYMSFRVPKNEPRWHRLSELGNTGLIAWWRCKESCSGFTAQLSGVESNGVCRSFQKSLDASAKIPSAV